METSEVTPGPDAHRAFRLGLAVAAALALFAVGVLFWAGIASLEIVAFALLIGFPIYLIYVASILSVWLGFDKDPSDLRPVYRERDETGPSGQRRSRLR